jgi:hypothetical protein
MLIVGPGFLVIAGIIGIWGSRFVGREQRAASGTILLPSG